MKNKYFLDPESGAKLLTTEQVAEYLGYEYSSIRHIVREGKLKHHCQAGNTLLFLEKDVQAYVARKTETKELLDKINSLPEKIQTKAEAKADKATLNLHIGIDLFPQSKPVENFSWDKIPEVKAQITSEYGKALPFTLMINNPDGGRWMVDYTPPNWLDKALHKLFKKRAK